MVRTHSRRARTLHETLQLIDDALTALACAITALDYARQQPRPETRRRYRDTAFAWLRRATTLSSQLTQDDTDD